VAPKPRQQKLSTSYEYPYRLPSPRTLLGHSRCCCLIQACGDPDIALLLPYRLQPLPCITINHQMGPVSSEKEEVEEMLFLDTTVDSTVDFTALSVLPEVTLGPGRAETGVG
ncbi:unnamed protein product, partial [Laminaria digitata]